MTIAHLVTHSGGFHADELLSCALLKRLYPDAQVVRTRDPDWITPAADRLVFDVGGACDPAAGIFDHHQRPGPLREDGRPYSSFGLIWAHFGRAFMETLNVPSGDADVIHKRMDTEFVLPVDLLDNGAIDPSVAGPLSVLTLPALLESLKPDFDDTSPTAQDDAFFAALPIVQELIKSQIRSFTATARARSIVLDAVAKAGASPILELPMGMPYRAALDAAGAGHILFVINPRGDEWTLGGVKLSADTFEQRADLPAAWAGLTGAALEKASGVSGASFCHNARFIAVAKTREAIVKMAEIAVQEST